MRAKERKTIAAITALPPQERAKVTKAMLTLGRRRLSRAAAAEAGQDIVLAYTRYTAKRDSDTRTDAARRVLVGARVPRSLADKCRAAAAAKGLSLYSWVTLALLAALQSDAAAPPSP